MEAFGVDGGEIYRQVHTKTFRVVANIILVRRRNRLMDSDNPLSHHEPIIASLFNLFTSLARASIVVLHGLFF